MSAYPLRVSYEAIECYSVLGQSKDLPAQLCDSIRASAAPDFQLATLALKLLFKQRTANEDALFKWVLREECSIAWLISQVDDSYSAPDAEPSLDENDLKTLLLIQEGQRVGSPRFTRLLERFLAGKVPTAAMAFILALISIRGLSDEDTEALTLSMVASGTIFDHREFAESRSRRLLRRYPTGGVSEKIALIMPSVLLALAGDLPLMSTTLVGRTLGFTGGTWDKLSVIPGFTFAQPGRETERILAKCPVAMCTTGPDLAPADQSLYVLRSMSGTIISEPLIVSSIGSKHLALPPHRILLDIRYGCGAFLNTMDAGKSLASHLERLFTNAGILTSSVLVETSQPSGSAIGNVLELLEAVAVMGVTTGVGKWDNRGLVHQRAMVIEQTVELLIAEFPHLDDHMLRTTINLLFERGAVFDAFCALISAHSVEDQFIKDLRNGCVALTVGSTRRRVDAQSSGFLAKLDQARLGRIVNFGLAPDRGEALPGSNHSGIWLKAAVGDHISKGDALCEVFSEAPTPEEDEHGLLEEIATCFEVTAQESMPS